MYAEEDSIQSEETVAGDDAAVDADADVVVDVERAPVVVAACLGFAGTLPTRAAWLLRKNLVSVYKSRNTKNPSPGGAFQSQILERFRMQHTWQLRIQMPQYTSTISFEQGGSHQRQILSLAPRTQSPRSCEFVVPYRATRL